MRYSPQMERTNKASLVKWKPSELLEVQRFCADRKLEYSTLVRTTLLYVVKNPTVFVGFAICSLDTDMANKLRTVELPLNWETPVPVQIPARKPKAKGKKRGRRVRP